MLNRLITLSFLLFIASPSLALDAVGQRYMEQLTQGGMRSIKQAAKSIYNTSYGDTKVLDVAAEVLLQKYPKAIDSDIDTLAWLSKAVGRTKNNRYYSAINEVATKTSYRKLAKHAKASLKGMNQEGKQYKKGSVKLAAVQKQVAKAKPAPKKSSGNASGNGLDIIREGMSREEVFDLIGQPTNLYSRQTGKAWIPFNFKGGDSVRTIALYKGKGRVVFSNTSKYTSGMVVREVVVDPSESGYP